MRTEETFLSDILSEETLNKLADLAKREHSTFSEQVKIVGLNVNKDLCYADLCGIDISRSDLRGFNLTGADLRGATGISFQMDSSTVLEGANLEGSVLASKVRLNSFFEHDERALAILKKLQRATIIGQLEWAATNLQPSGKYHSVSVPVVQGLLYRSADDFLRSEFLRYLAPRIGSRMEMKEMLLASIADYPDSAMVVGNAMQLFKRYGMAQDATVRQTAFTLLYSANVGIKTAVMRFLMRNGRTRDEHAFLRSRAYDDKILGPLFVGEIARKMGEEYDLVTRDPVTNETFQPDAVVAASTMLLIARRWLRAARGPDGRDDAIPLSRKRIALNSSWPLDVIERRALEVEKRWLRLQEKGINFNWEMISLGDIEKRIKSHGVAG